MEELVTYTGEVDEIVYYNNENSYAIFDLRIAGNDVITCVGTIYGLYIGEMMSVSGTYVEHKVYGRQLKVTSFEKKEIKSISSMIKYLSSGIFKGIGEKTAEKIVNEFREETFDIIENDYESLAKISGITKEKARLVHEEFILRNQMRSFIMDAQKLDISINMASKIYEKFKDKALHIIENNPYLLIDQIDEVTFNFADTLASKLDIGPDNMSRIEEGIRYVLKRATLSGHVYLPRNELIEKSKELLGVSEDAKIIDGIEGLISERKIFEIDDDSKKIYLKKFYYAECSVADKIRDLLEVDEYRTLLLYDNRKVETKGLNEKKKNDKAYKKLYTKYEKDMVKKEREINQILDELAISLSDEQYEAVLYSLMNEVTLITGGPGTGKTTIINVIVKYLELNKKKVALVAPTGRAAKRMSESTKREAKTIHRLLEVQPISIENERQQFARNEENPLEADVIIVDEMSMVDLQLFNSFLNAIEVGTKLILVGDDKQLPSVGPGNVLKDLLDSNTIKTCRLTQVFRQAKESMIIKNAHLIRTSNKPDLDTKNDDFFFIKVNDEKKALDLISDLTKTRLPKYLNASSDDIQVLAPMKKGNLGTQNINLVLQEVLNPNVSNFKNKREVKQGARTFRLGDKVMQIKNNYELEWEKQDARGFSREKGKGVFNGDMGRIVDIDNDKSELVIKFDDEKKVIYPASNLSELDLAYAITIHKSQGSEYKAVIIPVFDLPELMMNRNLIYTGITRAKTMIVLVGRKDIVYRMIDNDTDEKRYSNLKKQLEYRLLDVDGNNIYKESLTDDIYYDDEY